MKKTLLKSLATKLIAGMGILTLFPIGAGAQWVQTNGPLWGPYVPVDALVVSGGNVFAGTTHFPVTYQGVFLSTDNGTNWTQVLTDYNVYSLAISGCNLFAGVIDGSFPAVGGVFLSTDSGTSWKTVNTGLPAHCTVHSLIVSGNNLFAGTLDHGVYLSKDSSVSWTAVNTGLTDSNVNCLAINGSNIFAGTQYSGVFRSTNNGTSWDSVNSGLTNLRIESLAVSGRNIFAGTSGGGVFLSTDSGATWTARNSGLSRSVHSFAISGSNIFAGTGGDGVYLSKDSGATWTAVNTGLTFMIIYSLAVSDSNIFAGTQMGVVFRRPLSEMTGVINPKPHSEPQTPLVLKLTASTKSNHIAVVSFSLPRSSPVRLNIYNLSGHLITTLLDKPMTAGTHSVQWDARSAASGCYMVKMQVGPNTQVKSIPLFR